MFKVDTVTIPTPSTYSISILDISNAFRNGNGEMRIEVIATKRKLELTYNYLSSTDLATLFSRFSGTGINKFFTIEYPDSETGAIRTGIFYVGDRKSEAIDYQNGVARYKGITFNLIER